MVIKGIIHPKIKILSSFTHPEVVPNLYEFLSCWKEKKIFWFFVLHTMEVNGAHQLYGYPYSSILSSSVSSRGKKFIQVWNNL